jgi:hypothetical protein
MRNVLLLWATSMLVQNSNAALIVQSKDIPQVVRTDLVLTGDDAKNLIKLFNLNKNLEFSTGSNGSRFYLEMNEEHLRLSGGADVTWYWIDCDGINSQTPRCEVTAQFSIGIGGATGYVRRLNKTVYASFDDHDFPGSRQNLFEGLNFQLEATTSMNPDSVVNLETNGLGIKIYCTNAGNKTCGLDIRFP